MSGWLRVAFKPVTYWEAQGFAGKRISNKIIFFVSLQILEVVFGGK